MTFYGIVTAVTTVSGLNAILDFTSQPSTYTNPDSPQYRADKLAATLALRNKIQTLGKRKLNSDDLSFIGNLFNSYALAETLNITAVLNELGSVLSGKLLRQPRLNSVAIQVDKAFSYHQSISITITPDEEQEYLQRDLLEMIRLIHLLYNGVYYDEEKLTNIDEIVKNGQEGIWQKLLSILYQFEADTMNLDPKGQAFKQRALGPKLVVAETTDQLFKTVILNAIDIIKSLDRGIDNGIIIDIEPPYNSVSILWCDDSGTTLIRGIIVETEKDSSNLEVPVVKFKEMMRPILVMTNDDTTVKITTKKQGSFTVHYVPSLFNSEEFYGLFDVIGSITPGPTYSFKCVNPSYKDGTGFNLVVREGDSEGVVEITKDVFRSVMIHAGLSTSGTYTEQVNRFLQWRKSSEKFVDDVYNVPGFNVTIVESDNIIPITKENVISFSPVIKVEGDIHTTLVDLDAKKDQTININSTLKPLSDIEFLPYNGVYSVLSLVSNKFYQYAAIQTYTLLTFATTFHKFYIQHLDLSPTGIAVISLLTVISTLQTISISNLNPPELQFIKNLSVESLSGSIYTSTTDKIYTIYEWSGDKIGSGIKYIIDTAISVTDSISTVSSSTFRGIAFPVLALGVLYIALNLFSSVKR